MVGHRLIRFLCYVIGSSSNRSVHEFIDKLLKDRLNFDNEVTDLETTLRERRAELEELEALNTDAVNARDAARRELARTDKEATEARRAREEEKAVLTTAAEEQRKQFEAMERRLRQNNAGDLGDEEGASSNPELKKKITTYEEAMREIQDVTASGLAPLRHAAHISQVSFHYAVPLASL